MEKIKRERAAEEERKAREISEGKARDREDEIAMGNPLLNLEAALGQGKATSGKPGTFAVKKRWDDGKHVCIMQPLSASNRNHADVIFKNQGAQSDGPTGHFVNDLLRTEFHRSVCSHLTLELSANTQYPTYSRKFMAKFIK